MIDRMHSTNRISRVVLSPVLLTMNSRGHLYVRVF